MRKLFILSALILFSVSAASAQNGSGAKHHPKDKRDRSKAETFRVETAGASKGRVLRVGPSTLYLKNGLSTEEVEAFLGQPASISERQEGDSKIVTYVYTRGQGRSFVAEFVNGILIQSRTETPQQVAQTVNITNATP
jgi:hypothetical protein